MILGLQFERAESVVFATAPDFVLKLLAREERIETCGADKAVRVLVDRASDQVVLATIVVDNRERNGQCTIDAMLIHHSEQLRRRLHASAVTRIAEMRMGVEDPEAVLHGRAARIASVIAVVLSVPPKSRVRALRSEKTERTDW